MMYVFGGLDDQLVILVWEKVSHGLLRSFTLYSRHFRDLLFPLESNQPVLWGFLSIFLGPFWKLAGEFLDGYNFLLIVIIILTAFLSLHLFKRYKFSIWWTLIFLFSSYFWAHLGIHVALSQIWLYPLFLIQLKKLQCPNPKPREVFILSFLIAFSIGISNYIGFFILIYFTLYSFLKFIFTKDWRHLEHFFLAFLFSGFLSFLFLFPYIKANYFTKANPTIFPLASATERTVSRPYEDFFHFSSRPWYFFLPPVKNPWLGDFSGNLIDRLESTDYFLANDYFAGEHSANYFGLAFLLSVTVLSTIMLFKAPIEKKKQVAFYWILNFLLYLFMMPPFFTISGVKIYTPGELMYRFFPMFRVTVRMAPLLLLNFLVILSISVEYLSRKSQKYAFFFKVFVPTLALITLTETFIPPKIVRYDTPPKVYSYLGEVAPQEKFAVYPYSQTDEAFFWLDAHKGYLLNVRSYENADYNSEEFTKFLPTKDGITKLKSLGGKYLVVYKDLVSPEDSQFFLTSPDLVLVEDFPNVVLFIVKK